MRPFEVSSGNHEFALYLEALSYWKDITNSSKKHIQHMINGDAYRIFFYGYEQEHV